MSQLISIGGYTIDAVLNEEYTKEADASEYPVERGPAISDNIRIKPDGLRITGIVSDTPIGLVANQRTIGKDASGKSSGPAREALQALCDTFNAATPIDITTMLRTYTSMVFTGLSFPVEPVDAQTFTMTFKEIVIIDNVRTTVKVKLSKQKKGDRAGHPPGWIGTDTKGRDIISNKLAPGVEPSYTRADGTAVSKQEAADAARKNDSALVKYDKDGNAVPVDDKDYQPYTPKQKKPYWAPTPRNEGPVVPSVFTGG